MANDDDRQREAPVLAALDQILGEVREIRARLDTLEKRLVSDADEDSGASTHSGNPGV